MQKGRIPKGFLGALEDTPYSLDLEKAKAALAESGVTLPLEVSLTVRNNPERLDIAQSIQNTFGQIGINLTLDTTLNLNQLISDLLAVNRARNGEPDDDSEDPQP